MKRQMNADEELRRFKTDINLSEFAASRGFVKDCKKTSERSTTMHRGDDQTIIIAKAKVSGIYMYFQRGINGNNGTIVDFCQWEYNGNLGATRQHLRPWMGWSNRPKIDPDSFTRKFEGVEKSELDMIKEFTELWAIDDTRAKGVYDFLRSRGLSQLLVNHWRFKEHLRTDLHSNVIFPHYTLKKNVVGWEIKNRKFTGFPKGSAKSAWFSVRKPTDTRMLICESGLDALSFYALYPEYLDSTWCISTGGGWGPATADVIKSAILHCPKQVIMPGFDNDQTGRMYEAKIHDYITITREVDSRWSKLNDWNADLMEKLGLKR